MPSILLRKRFGIWGQQLWLFARGEWTEPVVVERRIVPRSRTPRCRSTSRTTTRADFPAERGGTVNRPTAARGAADARVVRVNPIQRFRAHRLPAPVPASAVPQQRHRRGHRATLLGKSMRGAHKPIRQICLGFSSLERLDTQPMLWGSTDAERWGAIDDALQVIEQRFGENTVMTGAQFALKKQNDFFEVPRPSAPLARAKPARPAQSGSIPKRRGTTSKTWPGVRRRLPGQALVWLAPACGGVKFPGRSRHENETADTAVPRCRLCRAGVLKPAKADDGPIRVLFLGHESEHHNSNLYCPMLSRAGRDAPISTTSPRSRRRWATPTISASLTPCCSTPTTAGSSRTSGRT